MDLLPGISSDALMSALYPQQDQIEQFSRDSLSHGIDLYISGDYKGAIKEFTRAIGLSPYSEYSSTASKYMANAYLQLGETEKAIGVYKKAVNLNPVDDDVRVQLGNLYFGLNRFEEAAAEYKEALRIYPSSNNYFSLGQAYLHLDRLDEAEAAFSQVKRMDPQKPNGDYGLGLTYSKMGLYEQAVEHFEKAVSMNKEFYDGYAEMGYAYMDMGDKDKAMEMVDFLMEKDVSLAYTLSAYIYQEDAPNFSYAYYTEAFGGFPSKTPLSSLDSYLANADASKTFTLIVVFDKEMDRESVENLANWRIYRSIGSGPGEAYNYGLSIPDTEVSLPPLPLNVYYDAENQTARVQFKITQNATADGTIDPSHVEFCFMGEDVYGNQMDPTADQYSTFSGVA